MTSINCSFSQVSGFNGGWIPHYELTNSLDSTSTYINGKINTSEWQFAVIPITVPAITGDTKGKYFTFKLNLHMKSSGRTYGTIYYAFSTKGRPDANPHYGESYRKSNMGTIIAEGSKEVSGIHGNNQSFEFTSSTFDNLNNNEQVIYLWVWSSGTGTGDGIGYVLGKNAAYYSIVLNYQEATKVSNPTTFTISDAITLPGKKVTIEWSGAKEGTSNPITGYRIYWKDGSAPNESSQYITVNSTTTSYTDYTASSTRGITRYFKIQTLGTVSGFNANISTSSVSVKANILPNVPTITANKIVVPSIGGDVSFTCIAGSANDNLQTGQVCYNIDTPTPKIENLVDGSNLTVTPFTEEESQGSSHDYYFWTWDGLEFSKNYQKITITKNIKPEIISVNVTGTEYKSSLNTSGLKYILNPTISCSVDKNIQGAYYYYFYKINDSDLNSEEKRLYSTLPLKSSSFSLEEDIRTLSMNEDGISDGFKYYCEVIFHDTVERSEPYRSEILCIPPLPDFGDYIYNDFNGLNVAGAPSTYFSNKASINVNGFDDGVEIEVNLSNINSYIQSITAFEVGTKGYNLLLANLNPGGNYVFTFNLINKLNITRPVLKTKTYNLTCILQIPLENFQESEAEGFEHKIYTSSNEPIFNCAYFDKDYYAFSQSSIFFSYKNKKGEELAVVLSISSSDTYSFSTSFSSLYEILPPNVDKDSIQSIKIPLYLKVTNAFGQEFISSPYEFWIDFREECIFKSAKLSVGDKDFANVEFLKEKMPIYFEGSIQSYNAEPMGQLQIAREDNPSDSDFVDYGTPFSFVRDDDDEVLAPNKPLNYSFEKTLVNTIGKIIKNNYNATFRLMLSNKTKTKSYTTKEWIIKKPVYGHTEPEINLTTAAFDGKNLTFVLNDTNVTLGINKEKLFDKVSNEVANEKEIEIELENGETKKENIITDVGTFKFIKREPSKRVESFKSYSLDYIKETQKIDYPTSFSLSEGWPTVAYLQISLTTTHKYLGYESSYTGYSNEILVYNVLPTTSYRTNHLGINYRPEDYQDKNSRDGILYISEYNNYNKIYLLSTSNGSSQVRTINLEDGKLDNFVIDGGTWDETS